MKIKGRPVRQIRCTSCGSEIDLWELKWHMDGRCAKKEGEKYINKEG